MTAPKTARTTKNPGQISPVERREIDKAVRGELGWRETLAWFAFAMRQWDTREEMDRWRGKVA